MLTPELVAAVAATIAAVFSGAGLWLTASREERKWQRDALVDTVVQYLDASFASPAAQLMRKRREGRLDVADREGVAAAHQKSLNALTRLRVVASANVVGCAEELHVADDEGSDIVLTATRLPDDEHWDRMLDHRRQLRLALLPAVRRGLRLRKAKPIAPSAPRRWLS